MRLRDVFWILMDGAFFALAAAAFLIVAYGVTGCASKVTAAPGCVVVAEVQTGTTIRCVEIERKSAADSIRAGGEALGGALRGLIVPPGVTP